MDSSNTDPDPLMVGNQITVTIESLAAGGDGIARVSGLTFFVPNSVPGDVLNIEITHLAKNFGRGRILSLQQPGPDRVPTPCPLAEGCPGCQLQQLRYEAQLQAKQIFVRDGLERIGHLKGIEVRPTLGMDDPWQYRNKGEFAAETQDGQVRLGYRRENGDFFPLPDCPIQHPLSIRILRAVEEVATREQLPLAQLITRVSPHENAGLAILVCWESSDRLRAAAEALQQLVPEIAGVLWSQVRGRSLVRRTLAELLVGRGTLIQQLDRWEYTVSAESFFQVNTVQAARLLELAVEFAGDLEGAIFADGYCGVGTFLLPLGSRAHRSLGIEEHPVALRDAQDNLARYALHDARLFEGRVEVILPRLIRRGREIDVALLDPPRKGAGPVVLEQLAELGASRLILVSCDPATLGRDVGDLYRLGYHLQEVQPVDMFPQTWHVETIAVAVKE